MHIPRLLLLALLIPVCIAPVVAQSSPDNSPAASQPQLDGLIAPPEFRAHVLTLPGLPTNVWSRIHDLPPQLSLDSLLLDDAICYSIRSYRVTRDDPQSDSTRPAGYSECQPAAQFQVKTAVDSQEMEPR
jgi:hypothetical protein